MEPPSGAVAPGASATQPHTCLRCGYSLTGLAQERDCPECAFPVASSLAAWEKWGGPEWARAQFRSAATGIGVAVALPPVASTTLSALASLPSREPGAGLGLVIGGTGSVLAAAALSNLIALGVVWRPVWPLTAGARMATIMRVVATAWLLMVVLMTGVVAALTLNAGTTFGGGLGSRFLMSLLFEWSFLPVPALLAAIVMMHRGAPWVRAAGPAGQAMRVMAFAPLGLQLVYTLARVATMVSADTTWQASLGFGFRDVAFQFVRIGTPAMLAAAAACAVVVGARLRSDAEAPRSLGSAVPAMVAAALVGVLAFAGFGHVAADSVAVFNMGAVLPAWSVALGGAISGGSLAVPFLLPALGDLRYRSRP